MHLQNQLAKGALAGMSGWGLGAVERETDYMRLPRAVTVHMLPSHERAPILLRERIQRK